MASATIAILTPYNIVTITGFEFEHNKIYELPHSSPPVPRGQRRYGRNYDTRDTIPNIVTRENVSLILSFSSKSFDPAYGFIFGNDSERCDVLLTEKVQ